MARRRVCEPKDEAGFTILEIAVALAVLAIVAAGFAASIGLGFRTIAVARQQTTASELATARLEHLRNVPYEYVALSSAPSYNADVEHPDHWVSGDGTQYDVTGEGQWEPLIVDTVNGGVLQVENPVQIGSTIMEIYQYVTWVQEPSVRRVTVVVRFKAPAVNGVNKIVRSATLFTDGTITFDLRPGLTLVLAYVLGPVMGGGSAMVAGSETRSTPPERTVAKKAGP
jgi:prepilin-type N-terminal cleavage/methylation domain-containing protein